MALSLGYLSKNPKGSSTHLQPRRCLFLCTVSSSFPFCRWKPDASPFLEYPCSGVVMAERQRRRVRLPSHHSRVLLVPHLNFNPPNPPPPPPQSLSYINRRSD